MNKLIATRGIPASGKTTWAREYCLKNPNTVRVNRDDIRYTFVSGKWSRDKEKDVIKIRDNLIAMFLLSGKTVISDDTNLSEKTVNHLKQLAEKCKSEFEIKDFTDISLTECLYRNFKRDRIVPENVIKEFYYRYVYKKPIIKNLLNLKNVVISDLDGTLALIQNGKNPYDRDFENDVISYQVLEMIKPYNIIFVSGRKEQYRKQTMMFLERCGNLSIESLYMRSDNDNRSDVLVKDDIYQNYIKDKYNVLFVVDDRKKVIRDVWVKNGIFVFNVNQYDLEF